METVYMETVKEAAERHLETLQFKGFNTQVQDAFIAGAQWQRVRDKKEELSSTTNNFLREVLEGKHPRFFNNDTIALGMVEDEEADDMMPPEVVDWYELR